MTSHFAVRYLEIVRALANREFVSSYRDNLLGAVSMLSIPVLFLATYTFVFSSLIPIRLRPDATRADYAFFLFSGLIVWNIFSETLARAPRLFESNSDLVRRALFPISSLPLAASLVSFYNAIIWLVVFVLVSLALGHPFHASVALAPLVITLVALLTAGLALVVATLGVFVRDLGALISPLLMLAMFLSPILYPTDRLEAISPWLVWLNPMAPGLDMLRALLLEGVLPSAEHLALGTCWAVASLLVGSLLYRRSRGALVDML